MKKICAILLSLVMVCPMLPIKSMAAPVTERAIYIDVNGNDASGDGSAANPFATLERAKEEIKTEKDHHTFPAEGQTVYLRKGVYHITSSLILNEDYDHTTWSAYPGEEVTISAATELPAALFTPVSGTMKALLPASAQDHVVVLDLASAGLSTADFTLTEEHAYPGTEIPLISDNGVMANIAAYPNEQYSWNWLQATGNNTAYGDTMPVDDTVAFWTYQIDQMFGYGYFSSFYTLGTYRVQSIDSGNKTLTFKEIYAEHPVFEGLAYENWVGNGIRLINAYQALDAPGEWYLDRAAGKFYYYPLTTAEDMHLEMTRDVADENAVICLAGVSDVHIRGLNLKGAMHYGIQGVDCSDCSVTDCDISLIKDTAVLLTRTKNCEISYCKIHDTGSGGVSIVDEAMLTKDRSKNNNTISNNEIYAVDRNKRVYAPAVYIKSTGNTVEHNEIHDLYHEAIEFYGAYTTIRYNDIYRVLTDCGDSGAIYTRLNVANIDSVISYNHIHGNAVSAGQPEKITHAVYFDDHATGDISVTNNIFGPEACEGAVIEINGGQKINIQDNLFLDTPVVADWNNQDADGWYAGVGGMYGTEGLPADPAYEASEYGAWYEAYPYLHDIETQSKLNNTLSHNILMYDSESPENPYASMWQQIEGSYYIGLDENKVIAEDIGSYFNHYDGQEFQLKADALKGIQNEWREFSDIEFHKIGIVQEESGASYHVVIHAQDSDGNDLSSLAEAGYIWNHVVTAGENLTVAAPVILGYKLSGASSQTYTNITADQSCTFQYVKTTPLVDASVSPTAASYDKHTATTGLTFTLTPGSSPLSAIKNGATALVPGTEYSVSGNVYTISQDYLNAKGIGDLTLTFDMGGGADPTAVIHISDSTPTGALTITTQPTDQSVVSGAAVSFTAAATTTVPGAVVTYQWQQLIAGTWTDVTGANTGAYGIGSTASEMNGNQYRCNLSDGLNTANTRTATLTVVTPGDGSGGTGGTSGGSETIPFFSLRFETNGGTSVSEIRRTENTTIDLTLTQYTPDREGYDFSGWYSDEELTNRIESLSLTADTTVYAGWTATSPGTPIAPVTPANPFTDVAERNWFYDDVVFSYENGLMQGMNATTFMPSGTATRAMIVTTIWQMEGSPTPEGANTFTDVANDEWYTKAITWANENGIAIGYGGNRFVPNIPVTREQLAKILRSYAEYKNYDTSATSHLDRFTDKGTVSWWAVESVQWAVGCGLVKGRTNGTLDPGGSATRAEFAAMLHRFVANNEKRNVPLDHEG